MDKEEFGMRFGVSQEYVNRLTDKEKEMYEIIRPMRKSVYSIDVSLKDVERKIKDLTEDAKSMGGSLLLNPDFQRGHVWSEERKIHFIENFFKRITPNTLRFNCANYFDEKEVKDLNGNDIVCIDGLQRLTAMRDFMAGNFKIFNKFYAEDLKGTPFNPIRYTFKLEIFDISTKEDLLKLYLDINTGGVAHSSEEIARVSAMLADLK